MTEELLSDDEARKVLNKILSLYPDAKGELQWEKIKIKLLKSKMNQIKI